MAFSQTTANIAALKLEIQSDPASRGYSAQGGNHDGIVALINAPIASVQIDQTWVSTEDFMAAIVGSEFNALTTAANGKLQSIITPPRVNLRSPGIRAMVGAIFTATGAGTTRAALGALQTRNGSRAEGLFGEDAVISREDVGKALQS